MRPTTQDRAQLGKFIAVAKGEEPADLVISGGQVVNVLSSEVYRSDIAVAAGRVIGLGPYEGRERFDASGLYVAPGFLDAHIHIESTMLTPRELARAVVPLGTTAIVADPHEIANVLGAEGVCYMLEASRDLPLTVFFMLPSCVPVSSMETAGAVLDAGAISSLLSHPRVLGLAEVMDYPGVLAGNPDVLDKLLICRGAAIDGHAPGLSGKALNAYVGAGIKSDHECVTAAEAKEKLRAGMHVLIREGSIAKNLTALLPAVNASNAVHFGLVSDDREPRDLLREGHVNFLIERAVALGLPPITAIQMVTVNAARYLGVDDIGAIAPGYRADLVLLNDLKNFRPRVVFKDGREVARDGCLTVDLPPPVPAPRSTIKIGWDDVSRLRIVSAEGLVKVIEVIPDQLVTRKLLVRLPRRDGLVVADTTQGINKLAVVERHRATGNVGLGFVRGIGLRAGALAASVAHDSHNIMVVGVSDEELFAAIKAVQRMGGGLAAVKDGRVIASVALPIAGLISDQPLERLAAAMDTIHQAARGLGSPLRDPFMVLSFLALPVIPALRLTDRGLVDVERFEIVSLFGED